MAAVGEIWIAGGYGDVGLRTARHLLAIQERPVVLAGRDRERAEAAAAKLGRRARGTVLDMDGPIPPDELNRACALINTVEPANPIHAETVMRNGGVFVDISASSDHLQRFIRHLSTHEMPGLGLLFAGLAPGLTNIVARHLAETVANVREIELGLRMGLGEHHGTAALKWFIDNLGSPYECVVDGVRTSLSPGAVTRRFTSPDTQSEFLGIGFGFADQLAIAQTNGLATARTFVALDPGWVTRTILLGLRSGMGRILARHAGSVANLLSRGPTMGHAGSTLHVRGLTETGVPVAEIAITMPRQADVTAVLTVLTVVAGLNSNTHGLVNADDIVSYESAVASLEAHLPGTAIWERRNGAGSGWCERASHRIAA